MDKFAQFEENVIETELANAIQPGKLSFRPPSQI